MMKTIDDYSIEQLLAVARAAKDRSWGVRVHPSRPDALTIYGKFGYVIHPDLGYVNDDDDAQFIATFDPEMVLSILERLAPEAKDSEKAE